MVALSERSDSIGSTYHLANPIPTENRLWFENICRFLRVEGIQLVGKESFSC
jgi:hypothetical protein